ncbi:hypothetical protein NBRC116493_11190 [Aurantivibrio infirmus]
MSQTKEFSLAAMGDIMLDREVGEHFVHAPEDFQFNEIREMIGHNDLVLANLENPVGTRGAPHPKQDPHVAFRCHPRTLPVLKNLSVDVVTLANNHLLDYGEETLSDTLRHLDDAGIKHLGAGNNYEEANRPVKINLNGIDVAILSSVMIYSASTERAKGNKPGVADYRIAPLIRQVKSLKQAGYVVLVTIHWGIEYCLYPIPYQREQAKRMIDAGASLVLGHGPHFPQGIEKYGCGEIVHSLGNFIFDEPYPNARRSFIYSAVINEHGELTSRKIYPVTLLNHIPVLDKHSGFNRTELLVNHFIELYNRKSKKFWKKINSRWLSDIVWRISWMKSIKFAFLPPVSFYFSVGLGNILKKLKLKNLWWAFKGVLGKIFKR